MAHFLWICAKQSAHGFTGIFCQNFKLRLLDAKVGHFQVIHTAVFLKLYQYVHKVLGARRIRFPQRLCHIDKPLITGMACSMECSLVQQLTVIT